MILLVLKQMVLSKFCTLFSKVWRSRDSQGLSVGSHTSSLPKQMAWLRGHPEDWVPTFPSLPVVSGSMSVHVNGSLPKKEGTDQMDCQPCHPQCGFLFSVRIPQWS